MKSYLLLLLCSRRPHRPGFTMNYVPFLYDKTQTNGCPCSTEPGTCVVPHLLSWRRVVCRKRGHRDRGGTDGWDRIFLDDSYEALLSYKNRPGHTWRLQQTLVTGDSAGCIIVTSARARCNRLLLIAYDSSSLLYPQPALSLWQFYSTSPGRWSISRFDETSPYVLYKQEWSSCGCIYPSTSTAVVRV